MFNTKFMTAEEIIALLPYSEPFQFVEELIDFSENGVTGGYTFKPDAFFYKGHFKDFPVTPGVILTETMAQIGVVCLGIFLLRKKMSISKEMGIAMTSSEIDFLAPVFPGEKVMVSSEKVYFRFGKLKCKVKMENSEGKIVCHGIIAGMIKPIADEK